MFDESAIHACVFDLNLFDLLAPESGVQGFHAGQTVPTLLLPFYVAYLLEQQPVLPLYLCVFRLQIVVPLGVFVMEGTVVLQIHLTALSWPLQVHLQQSLAVVEHALRDSLPLQVVLVCHFGQLFQAHQ